MSEVTCFALSIILVLNIVYFISSQKKDMIQLVLTSLFLWPFCVKTARCGLSCDNGPGVRYGSDGVLGSGPGCQADPITCRNWLFGVHRALRLLVHIRQDRCVSLPRAQASLRAPISITITTSDLYQPGWAIRGRASRSGRDTTSHEERHGWRAMGSSSTASIRRLGAP